MNDDRDNASIGDKTLFTLFLWFYQRARKCAMIPREGMRDFHSKLKHSFLKSEKENPK